MKNSRSNHPAPHRSPAHNLSFELTRSKVVRLVVVGILLLALLELALFGGSQPNVGSNSKYQSAAVPTISPSFAATANDQLPQTKAEAQAHEKAHQSKFSFTEVDALKLKTGAGGATGSLPLEVTPTPTGKPTALKPFLSASGADFYDDPTGSGTSGSDDTFATAVSVTVNLETQRHTFDNVTPHTSVSTPDIDHIKFVVNNPGYTYNISTDVISSGVDTAIQLYDSSLNLIAENNDIGISPASFISFVPTTTGAIYYVRILNADTSSGFSYGAYTIRVDNFPPPASPTPTPTSSVTATADITTCKDAYESDDNPKTAKLLKVTQSNTPPYGGSPGLPGADGGNDATQAHLICGTGDIDWVYFDLVKGKSYSIFTSSLKNGLDSFMVLYSADKDGNVNGIYSSDDYPGAGLASRIDFVVPTQSDTPLGEFARYYLAVKDVAGHGGNFMSYNLTLSAAGNGLGDCFDAYEPNGEPFQAKDILVNETQTFIMCPNTDRDWAKFFAKSNSTYTLATGIVGTRPPGLDTKLEVYAVSFNSTVVTQVDSLSLIGENDDRAAGDLNSQVTFNVPADGFYYAVVRNAGDQGRNGMLYTLSYAVGTTAAPPPPTTAAPATATAAPTVSVTATAGAASDVRSFADPSFQSVWNYADLAVSQSKASRSWLYGNSGATKLEDYAQAKDGSRQVQYFDKSRMEINNPKGDRASKWFVSNGLLVKEMISGQIATGDTTTIANPAGPANISVAGDLLNNPNAPTYASFAKLITLNGSNAAPNRTGQSVTEAVNKAGAISNLDKTAAPVKYSAFIKETSHNIPDVFMAYLTQTGIVYDGKGYVQAPLMDWVFVMGLPLTEAYWTKSVVAGKETDVLVQIYERRVLTFTPSNPAPWQVEMANVGQHYYQWRYNSK